MRAGNASRDHPIQGTGAASSYLPGPGNISGVGNPSGGCVSRWRPSISCVMYLIRQTRSEEHCTGISTLPSGSRLMTPTDANATPAEGPGARTSRTRLQEQAMHIHLKDNHSQKNLIDDICLPTCPMLPQKQNLMDYIHQGMRVVLFPRKNLTDYTSL